MPNIKSATGSTVQGSSKGRFQQSAEFGTYFFPGDIGSDVYTNTMIFESGKANYVGNGNVEVKTKDNTDSKVELYMPAEISDENSRDWSETEVGAAGQHIANGGSLNNNVIGKANSLLGNAGNIGSDVGNTAQKNILNAMGQAVGSEGAAAASLARSGDGRAVNPKLEMLFQGVGFKEYSFDFSMYPRTEDEAKMIQNIIMFFKYRSAPELDGGGYFFKWPDIFKLKFKNPEYLFDFEPCACTSVSTNYTPEGMWAEMKNGAPVGVQLSLSFTELNIRTKDNYKKDTSGKFSF